MDKQLFEDEKEQFEPDPDEKPIQNRKIVTQPYDLNISSLMSQIKDNTLHLRPLSERPRFQRKYVWPNRLASLLIESMLLNIPIPPCYFSQNDDFELDVIDGQQRIFSIYRFVNNQYALTNLEVLSDLNGKRFHEINKRIQRQIETHTLRSVIITNASDPEIQFDVFERLNTNTMPLNSQELRNCMYRGTLNDLLGELAEYEPWLDILGKKEPDNRLRDEELILRFFSFVLRGLDSYSTPQKHWLNETAKSGRKFDEAKIKELDATWKATINNCLHIFDPGECFRRIEHKGKRGVVNRALMDLEMTTLAGKPEDLVKDRADAFRGAFAELLEDDEFQDLISRAIDHKKRTLRRFEIWNDRLIARVF